MGNVGFVSHQWVAKRHPDPELRQMQVLKESLRHVLSSRGQVPLDPLTEVMVHSAKGLSFKDFQEEALFLWYDYFSVPQALDGYTFNGNDQAKAITSIPAYVAKSRYFFALCPTIDCPFEGRVLNFATWSRRGWCQLERACRELSGGNTEWIVVQSPSALRLVSTVLSFAMGSVGEGEYTVESDRAKLAPVMEAVVKRKLIMSLKSGDLASYRRHLNLQSVHLRGLNVSVSGMTPGNPNSSCEVEHFFHQNGFSQVGHRDPAGWWPLHYAAMSGEVSLIEGLLRKRADVNRRTSKDEPNLGVPFWVSALDLCMFFKHNKVAKCLIQARARPAGGILTSLHCAAASDNSEGIQLLLAARANPEARGALGAKALAVSALLGSRAALDELVRQTEPSGLELSVALELSIWNIGGSAEMVLHLIDLKADVNFQLKLSRDQTRSGRLLLFAKRLQYRFGSSTLLTTQAYHLEGRSPLMAALMSAQHEGAAALIAAGARLDLRNRRGYTAADFAQGGAIPTWLQQGLQGDSSGCQRVTSLALPNGLVEVQC